MNLSGGMYVNMTQRGHCFRVRCSLSVSNLIKYICEFISICFGYKNG